MSHVEESEPKQLLFGIAQHLTELAVDAEIFVVTRDLRHADGRQFEQRAELFLAPAQLLFDPPALGHVALRGDEMRHFAALVAHRPGGPFEMKFRAILAVIDRLAVEDLARRAILTQLVEHGAIGLGTFQDARRFADYFFRRVAGHLREGRVDVNNPWAWRVELRRHNDDRFITLLDRRFEQPQLLFGSLVVGALRA